MKVIEPGQDRKIAALKSSFHVHFYFGGNMNSKYMKYAFDEAKIAFDENEVPIGAVIVKDGKVIARAHNLKEHNNCCIYHAEILAIMHASNIIDNWRLDGCDIYVTLDPCPMCASAIKQARISNIFSANNNADLNNNKLLDEILKGDKVNPSVNLISNIDREQSRKILNDFFNKQRNN